MAKCLVCVSSITVLTDASFAVAYSASLDNPIRNWSGFFTPNVSVNVATNLTNWKAKMVTEAAGLGGTIVAADVIIFGAPA